MTPDQVAAADQTRTAYLTEQARRQRRLVQQEQALRAHEQAPQPPVERGPSIEI